MFASSDTIAPSGSSAPITAAAAAAVSSPSGSAGRWAGCGCGRACGATRSASDASAPHTSSPGRASVCTWQPPGTSELGSPG